MTPIQHYQHLVAQDAITFDAEQFQIVQQLDTVFQQLLTQQSTISQLKLILGLSSPPKGFYLWGGVGTGKTFMIDNFYNCLPIKKKLRMHFHSFMQYVHYELKTHQGKRNPLNWVAKKFAEQCCILCLDELIVDDITDAMMLAELIKALLHHNICLIFTTNLAPDQLYLKGLQRQRFLPAIKLIKKNCKVVEITSQIDYRFRHDTHAPNYFTPIDETTEKKLSQRFAELSNNSKTDTNPITLHSRQINIIKKTNSVIWFDFLAICDVPRSQHDYIALAKEYHTVFVSNVKKIEKHQHNLARAFINLVDVFYDNKIKLVISGEVRFDQLYLEGKLVFAFARTQSRLTEMQASDWPPDDDS